MARAPHQRGGGPDLPEIEIAAVNLREVIADVKAISPRMATNLRRNLRAVGDDIVAAQKGILSGASRGNAVRAGSRLARVSRSTRTGRSREYVRRVNVYRAQAAKRSRSRGMRDAIKASLKTRVVAGKTRSGITIQAQRSVGGVMTKVWNKKVFRHPTFGNRDAFVSQFGQPYWWQPIKDGREAAQEKARAAVRDALEGRG